MDKDAFDRIGLVVHPRRELGRAVATIRDWAERQDATVVQVQGHGHVQQVAPPGDPAECDLIIALGGDGTALAALRAAAPVGRPVLGVACGSLGALTATTAEELDDALGLVANGDWTARKLPALIAERDGGEPVHAINDLVFVRDGAGQVMVEIELDDDRYVRFAGDGVVAATPLGSTAYTLAAGGPVLAPGATGQVLTPLSPHGGVCPPVVVAAGIEVELLLDPGNGGARLEVDGQIAVELPPQEPIELKLRCREEFATLVSLGEQETLMAGLRRRRILLDSPRVLARDDREAAAARG
jgi:NAD+ kinase